MVSGFTGEDFFLPPSNENLLEALRSYDRGVVLTGSSTGILIAREDFGILRSNDHLRTLLMAFLELDVQYMFLKRVWMRRSNSGRLRRWLGGQALEDLRSQVKDLKVHRDRSFRDYEMLRRLTDWDNALLQRTPYF